MEAIIWIGLALVCGAIGKDRECGSFYAFGWGMICPLIGFIYAITSKRNKTQMEAFQELEYLKEHKLVENYIYEKMKLDIADGKIRPLDWYLNDGEKKDKIRNTFITLSIATILIVFYIAATSGKL